MPDLQNSKSSVLHSLRMTSYGLFLFKEKKKKQPTFKAGIAADQQSKGLSLSEVETGRGGGSKGRLSRKGKIRHVLISLLPLGKLYCAREVFCNDHVEEIAFPLIITVF